MRYKVDKLLGNDIWSDSLDAFTWLEWSPTSVNPSRSVTDVIDDLNADCARARRKNNELSSCQSYHTHIKEGLR